MMFSVPGTQIINMLNIKAVHHLLFACHTGGNHVGNPNACFSGFLHRDASCPEKRRKEKNYKNL